MMKFIRFLLLLSFPFYLFSCKTPQTAQNYLQNVSDSSVRSEVLIPDLIIQKNDLLSIQVYSASTRPELSDALYNLPSSGGGASGSSGGSSSGGFLVDGKGNIEYPRIGTLQAAGLNKLQLADVIKRKINETDSVLTNPSVIIRFLNLRVTIIGEVNTQGALTIPSERVTVLEAIGLAGGMTEYGEKDKVKILREINGKRQIGIVDLASNKLFESEYYNLMQNDVIIVEPTKRKSKKAEQDVVLQRISLGLSLITAIALLYNIFR